MPCDQKPALSETHYHANDAGLMVLGNEIPHIDGNRAGRTADGEGLSAPATTVSGVQRPSELSVSEVPELPSEGILRSYAASQRLQIERQQSLSHPTVLPFLTMISLEQATLPHVLYIPIEEQEGLHCAAGRAAAAA